ncbi:MAG: hypothetical protein Kow0042_06490 [Calditrichia bacterium]
MNLLTYPKIILGWRHWAVFHYNAFLENVFIVFYIALAIPDYSNQFIFHLLMFYLFSVFSTSYGYLVNDLADRQLDAEHGKENTFQHMSTSQAVSVVLSVLFISGGLAIPFLDNSIFIILWILWLLTATFYSLKPIRLKERGRLGLIVVVCSQRLLPALLVFAAFEYHRLLEIILFSAYTFFRGISSDLNHQLEDYHRDVQTATRTFVVQNGAQNARRIFHWILEIEKILLLFILIRIVLLFIQKYPAYWIGMAILTVVYISFYLVSLYQIGKGYDRNPFLKDQKNVFQFIHHPFPTIILPVVLCGFLLIHNFNYIFVIILFILNKGIFKKETLFNNFLVVIFKEKIWGWLRKHYLFSIFII